MRGFLLSSTLVIVLAGCASTPILTQDATYPPQDHLFAQQYTRPSTNTQKITIVRGNHTMAGYGLPIRVSVDSVKVAVMDPAEKIDLYLNPGDHMIAVGPDKMRWNTSDASSVIHAPTTVTLYRIAIDVGGIKLNPATE